MKRIMTKDEDLNKKIIFFYHGHSINRYSSCIRAFQEMLMGVFTVEYFRDNSVTALHTRITLGSTKTISANADFCLCFCEILPIKTAIIH